MSIACTLTPPDDEIRGPFDQDRTHYAPRHAAPEALPDRGSPEPLASDHDLRYAASQHMGILALQAIAELPDNVGDRSNQPYGMSAQSRPDVATNQGPYAWAARKDAPPAGSRVNSGYHPSVANAPTESFTLRPRDGRTQPLEILPDGSERMEPDIRTRVTQPLSMRGAANHPTTIRSGWRRPALHRKTRPMPVLATGRSDGRGPKPQRRSWASRLRGEV